MQTLTQLPNIGDALAEKLAGAGIQNYDDLASLGSVKVLLKIRDGVDPGACYNMLYAVEGAIRGVRWHEISRDERMKLKGKFDDAAGH
jgi:DNA transformation protein and related proteins